VRVFFQAAGGKIVLNQECSRRKRGSDIGILEEYRVNQKRKKVDFTSGKKETINIDALLKISIG